MILLCDCETTDLLSPRQDFLSQPGIVQLAAVKLSNDLRELDSFNILVNPEKHTWSESAMATHGITHDDVKDAPTFFEAGRAFAEFALGCDTWGGYNCKFDKDVIWWQLLRYGLEKNFPWPLRDVDVMKRAGKIMEVQGKRGMKHPKLSEAYEYCFKRPMENAHDAMGDVRATAEVWRWTTLYIEGGSHDEVTDHVEK